MYILMTLDICGLPKDDPRRKIFYDLLEGNGWPKVEDVSTTWERKLDGESESSLVATITKQIDGIAETANVKDFKAVFSISNKKAIVVTRPSLTFKSAL